MSSSAADMENMLLVQKRTITTGAPTARRQLFLSNIDLTLVSYVESVAFFQPTNESEISSFNQVCYRLCDALSRLLVVYDFVAGRLSWVSDEERFEIDCNGQGVVVATVTTTSELSQLGELRAPKSEYKQLVAFVQDAGDGDFRDAPLLLLQLTRFNCGGLALAARANHCTFDGMASHDFLVNLAAFTRGDKTLPIVPDLDRTVFRARFPPKIDHPHFEYAKLTEPDQTFCARGVGSLCLQLPPQSHLSHVHCASFSKKQIDRLKSEALTVRDEKLTDCTTFHVVAAKLWKAKAHLMGPPDYRALTVLFPVDIRRRMVPPMPPGFAGNALVPGFARASVGEIRSLGWSNLVRRVQEGIERLDDAYVRSGIDWLEAHRGVPCKTHSFSVVAWWRLGLEGVDFWWGRVECVVPIGLKPGLVILLPEEEAENGKGAVRVCLELPLDQVDEFNQLILGD